MARKSGKQKRLEKKMVMTLCVVAVVAVATILSSVSPPFARWLNLVLGITPKVEVAQTGSDSPTAVHFIDVGQGDAILLEESGEFALIDAGPPEGKDNLLAYLDAAGVRKLKYVFMTHPHADHIGGMQEVVEQINVEKLILPDFSLAPYPTASTVKKLLEAVIKHNIPTETGKENAVYPLGTGSIEIWQAGQETEDNYNILSLVTMFEAGGFRFLSTGDAEKQNERALLESGRDLSAQVMKAGHHGSASTSNTIDFVRAVSPAVVGISCATGNSYGHPHKKALEHFEDVGALVLRTDQDGCIKVQPDGNGGLAYGITNNKQ